jgi:Fic family protein
LKREEFTASAPGELLRTLQGDWSFLPNRLPPTLRWDTDLVARVARAERAVGRLRGMGEKLANPQPLVRFFLRREAELSSRIEGTTAGVQTMLLFEQQPDVETDSGDVREVHNAYRALEFGVQSLAHRPISLHLVKEMHELLLRGVRGDDTAPGQFRYIQVFIGATRDIGDARFVPSPPPHVEPAMRDLIRYVTEPDDLPSLVRAGLVHYQFEAIHPFGDGNGRLGRVLLLLMLIREGVLPIPLFNLSAHLERNRLEYYDRLLRVSQRGEWEQWLRFFLAGVVDETDDAICRIERIEQLRAAYQTRVRTPRSSALLPRLIDHLFAQPAITRNGVAELLGIGYTSAQALVDKLLRTNIVRKVPGRRREQIYLARGIVDLFADRTGAQTGKQS